MTKEEKCWYILRINSWFIEHIEHINETSNSLIKYLKGCLLHSKRCECVGELLKKKQTFKSPISKNSHFYVILKSCDRMSKMRNSND